MTRDFDELCIIAVSLYSGVVRNHGIQRSAKQLDESTQCPLCKASMYWIEAEQYDQDITYHECNHCQHQLYTDQKHNCYCDQCLAQRKRMLKEVRLQENRKFHKNRIGMNMSSISSALSINCFCSRFWMNRFRNIASIRNILTGMPLNIIPSARITCISMVWSKIC